MLEGYFLDMYLSLREVVRACRNGGKVAYVVGNARYYGVELLVDEFTAGGWRTGRTALRGNPRGPLAREQRSTNEEIRTGGRAGERRDLYSAVSAPSPRLRDTLLKVAILGKPSRRKASV